MLFALLSSLVLSSGLFTEPSTINHIKSQDLGPIIENPDRMIMAIIYDESSAGSILLSKVLSEIGPKFSHYIDFVVINCENEESLCKEELRSNLPVFQGYVPAGLNPYTGKPLVHERPYQGLIAAKEISSFFNEHIPYLGEFIENTSNKDFLEQEGNKVILFTNKDKVPVIYRGLSSKYRGWINFGVVWHHQTQLVKHYGISEFPTLLVVDGDDYLKYEGKIEFESISEFLEKYKAEEKREPKLKKNFSSKPPTGDEPKMPEFPIVTLTAENYDEYLVQDTGLYLVQFYKDKQSPDWEDIKKDYNGIVKLATFNCKTKAELELCQSAGAKKFPSIRVFPVNRKRKSFELSFDSRSDLEEELSRELRYDITSIQEATIQSFVSAITEESKVGILLIAEGNIPLQFKAIASEASFKDFVKFGNFNRPREQALSVFSIKNYPAIIAFAKSEKGEGMQVIEYTGKFDDYRSLYYFIDQAAIPTFVSNHKVKISEEDQEDIEIVTSASSFLSKCIKKSGLCVIGFFEGEIVDNTLQSKAYKALKSVKAQMDSRKVPVHFVILDGLCQYELRETFGISEISLPNLGIFHTSRKKGVRLIGTFNVDDVSTFIEGIMRSKVEMFDMPSLEFKNRDCESLKTVVENDEDDEILQEILSKAEDKSTTHKSSDTKRGRRKKGSKKNNDL